MKGWPGGDVWINTNTLLARKGFLNRLFRENEMSTGSLMTVAFDKDMAMSDAGRARQQARLAMRPEQRGQLNGQYFFDARRFLNDFPKEMGGIAVMTKTVLAGEPVQVDTMEPTLAGLRALVLDPMYQLK
jgi:hypothetical protein